MPDDPRPGGASVGVVIVGHGETASRLLAAARGIASGCLDDLHAVDAGDGETPELEARLCESVAEADAGRGVLLIVDLVGSSPCSCGRREAAGHKLVTVGGLNLAMLLKLASLDRSRLDLSALAAACVDSARRACTVMEGDE